MRSARCLGVAWLGILRTDFDGLFEAFTADVDEVLCTLADLADVKGLVQVGVHAVKVHAHVQVDNVAVLQRAQVRDAVADDLVHRPSRSKQQVDKVSERRT